MAVDRELRLLLQHAHLPEQDGDVRHHNQQQEHHHQQPMRRVAARAIFDKLQTAWQQPLLLLEADGVNLAELLVLLAEAAIHQRDFATAQRAVDWFLHDCTAKNQFYCRAQFARAHCASQDAAGDTGALRLRKVLNAIHFVLLVLPIVCDARKRPQYDFLVYNASITYWQIARQLMKPGTFQFLAPSLTKIVETLRAVGERDVLWVATLQLALVSAQLDAKQFANAAKTVNDLADVQLAPLLLASGSASDASSHQLRALYDSALRAQVHVGSMKDPECQKIVPNVKKIVVASTTSKRGSLLVKMQCIKSGNIDKAVDAAYTEIIQEATGFAAFSLTASPGTSDEELMNAFLHSLDAKSIAAIDAEVIVETGLHAAFSRSHEHDELRVAHCCDLVLQRKGKSLAPRFRVQHQILKAALLVLSPLTASHGDNKHLDAAERQNVLLARRMEAIKVLERSLLSAKRQEDPNLVESVCVYAWNLALPLLQPHLRGQLSRVLTLSASMLEEMDSLLLVLRSRLHLEISKVEIKSEFLSKAYESVNKALALDYGASIMPVITIDDVLAQEHKTTTRPVDLHLLPLKKKLEWKLDIEDDAKSTTDSSDDKHIRALVESAKETKDTGDGLRALLNQATELLVAQVAAEVQPEGSSPPQLELLVVLWVDVCKIAWEKLKDGSMVEQFAKQGLEVFFTGASMSRDSESPLRVEKSLRVLEIDFRTLLVEILAARIKSRALELEAAKNQQQHAGKATRLGSRSKGSERKEKPASEIELAALKLLSEEAFVLGMHHATNASTQGVSNGEEAGDAGAIETRAKSIEDQVLGMKKELVEHFVASLAVAGLIGWRFVLENTCVYLWNYHFQLFRMLVTKSSGHALSVQWVLPECVAAFEAAYAALEAFPERDGELLVCNALGLSSVYEMMGRWDKVLAIADTFLKRKPSSFGGGHGAVSSIYLMRFAEQKTRAQLAQNAKEISPGDTASPYLKVTACLEALEVSFQQQQSADKSQVYYQKALALWQSIAGEMLAVLTTNEKHRVIPEITLEEVQQQTEIYVELWTRIAHGALRLQQFRFVVECATQALAVLSPSLSSSDDYRNKNTVITSSAWRWLAVSEILCGRAVLALGNGDKTPKKLVVGSLRHLVDAAEYADRATAGPLVLKASEVAWNAALLVLSNMNTTPEANEYESVDVKLVIRMLKKVLFFLSKAQVPTGASATPSTNFYGDLVLLTLAVCEKSSEWVESCAVCEDALAGASSGTSGMLSVETLNEIRTASAISAAKLGKPGGGGGPSAKPGGTAVVSGGGNRSTEQQDPLLKAKILKKIAFSSMKDPPARLKALASAYAELDGRPEEQVALLMDMGEWFYTNRVSSQDADMYLDSAAKVLLASETMRAADPAATRNGSRSGTFTVPGDSRAGFTSATASKKDDADIPVYSAIWVNEKLIRVFVMRAMTATLCSERWKFVERAAYCVDRAWQSIMSTVNEMELQEAFDKVTPSDLDFDEWKRSQKLKYSVPRSSHEWLAFYFQYAKSTDARFYMEWVVKLQSAASATALHFTEPVVTGFYLEKLLVYLQDDMADELLLPVICLYQVLYFGFSPTKTRIMELWLELTLFDILERHNLAACALPLQSALEIFQLHGKTFVEELQTQSGATSGSPAGYVSKGICRPVLESASVNLRMKLLGSSEANGEVGRRGKARCQLAVQSEA
ncbi:hypothetical protein Gpo141_00012101 [Globisporangium polare]